MFLPLVSVCCTGDYPSPPLSYDDEQLILTWITERDSRKDEAIVFIFIIATGSLLLWAVFRPWVQKWMEV
jgi:hypothetical protein